MNPISAIPPDYLIIVQSLPIELKLEILVYSLSHITEDHADRVLEFIEILALYTPATNITFCTRSTAEVKITLMKKVHLRINVQVASLLKSNMTGLLDILKLKIKKIVVNYKALTEDFCPTLTCINQLLLQITPEDFEIDATNLHYDINPWFSEITHIVNSKNSWRFNDPKLFPKLKCVTQKTGDLPFLNNTELSKFIHDNERLKVIINFSMINFPIDESFLSFLKDDSNQVEFIIGDNPLILNENTVQFFSSLKELYEVTLIDSSYSWTHQDNIVQRFDLLPQLNNIKSLAIKAKSMKNLKLENSKISQMFLTTSNCQDTDFSKLTRLYKIVINCSRNGYATRILITRETFKSLTNQITQLAMNSPITLDESSSDEPLPLPRCLQSLTSSVEDLDKFDLSLSEHLNSLSVYLSRGINEDDKIWNSIPDSIESLELKYPDFNLIPSLEKSNKMYGVSIDPKKFKYLELKLGISGYANIVCINTDFSNLFGEVTNIYSHTFCKWVRVDISEDTKVNLILDPSYFQFVVLPENDFSHVQITSLKYGYHYLKRCSMDGNVMLIRD